MRAALLCGLVMCMASAAQAGQPPAAPGFTLTLDGDGFATQEFVLKPIKATYSNNYWKSSSDPRVNRVNVDSDPQPGGAEIKIGVPATVGASWAFDERDQDSPTRNPYLHFELYFWDAGQPGP